MRMATSRRLAASLAAGEMRPTLGPHSPSELYYIGPDLRVDVIVPEVSGSGSDESVE